MMVEVSIILLAHNKPELTAQCIKSLVSSVGGIDYEVIVINNASDEEPAKKFFEELSKETLVLTTDQNYSFAKANNIAAQYAKGQYILFLNNDTVLTPGFLGEMLALRKRKFYDKCRIVGCKLLFPDTNKVQHIGVILRQDSLPTHLYYGKDLSEKSVAQQANEERKCVAVTAACMLIDNLAFRELGGFDERYINGFEDTDLCFKAKEKGYKSYYCPKALVYHIEHGSGEIDKGSFDNNVNVFANKWHNKLPTVNVA